MGLSSYIPLTIIYSVILPKHSSAFFRYCSVSLCHPSYSPEEGLREVTETLAKIIIFCLPPLVYYNNTYKYIGPL